MASASPDIIVRKESTRWSLTDLAWYAERGNQARVVQWLQTHKPLTAVDFRMLQFRLQNNVQAGDLIFKNLSPEDYPGVSFRAVPLSGQKLNVLQDLVKIAEDARQVSQQSGLNQGQPPNPNASPPPSDLSQEQSPTLQDEDLQDEDLSRLKPWEMQPSQPWAPIPPPADVWSQDDTLKVLKEATGQYSQQAVDLAYRAAHTRITDQEAARRLRDECLDGKKTRAEIEWAALIARLGGNQEASDVLLDCLHSGRDEYFRDKPITKTEIERAAAQVKSAPVTYD